MTQGETGLQRGLRSRHMTMIGIGGIIGAGLFVSSGVVIGKTGPAAIIAYAAGGLIVVLVMRMLGELAAANPSAGSFSQYSQLAFGRWAGFLVGWSYWYFAIAVIAFEAVAGAKLAGVYIHGLPVWLGALVLLALLTAANLMSVKIFGETEFWLATIKVTLIVGFLGGGALYLVGLWSGHGSGNGFSALTAHGGFVPKGWGAVLNALVTVIFSYFGAEIVTIAAAESADPSKEVARATMRVIWRVLVFYVGSVVVIVSVVPWNQVPADGQQSPFATAIGKLGIHGAVDLMTVVILVAVMSLINAGLFAASRMMVSLASRGEAPAIVGRVCRSGVPAHAILMGTGVAAALVVIAEMVDSSRVFEFLLNAGGLLTLILYMFVTASQIRLRRSTDPAKLTVRMWGFPWLSWIVLILLGGAWIGAATSKGVPPAAGGLALILAATLGVHFVRSRLSAPVHEMPDTDKAAV